MSEEVKVTYTDEELEAAAKEYAEKYATEEEFMASMLIPGEDGEELPEEALDMVAGGMSNAKAITIVASCYWNNVVLKKKTWAYSGSQVKEAIKIVDGLNSKLRGACTSTIIWGVKKLLGM